MYFERAFHLSEVFSERPLNTKGCRIFDVAAIAESTRSTIRKQAKNVSTDMAGISNHFSSMLLRYQTTPYKPPRKVCESISEMYAVNTSIAEYLKPAANVPSFTFPTKKPESQH